MLQAISVIVPVYNGGAAWERCLDALLGADPPPLEIIVVDDGSTDGSRLYAESRGSQTCQTPHPQSGPGMARNLGAQKARGEILFFIDADVVVQPDVISCVANAFDSQQVSAIFGSYDDAPGADGFLSQYRNLLHHYIHQTSGTEATSFWAGCGAIRKDVFLRVGGFSSAYVRPSIEDIELGYRLTRRGYRILLVKQLQVKHLKRWSWRNVLQTDIRDRALPWAELLARQGQLPRDLNLKISHRISAFLCWLAVVSAFAALLVPWASILLLFLLIALGVLNHNLYGFFLRRRGLAFTMGAVICHWFYYLYSSATFAYVLALGHWRFNSRSIPGFLSRRMRE